MQIEQKSTFRRAYRKLHPNQRQIVDDAIRTILKTPSIGEEKRGDLNGVWVYKFDCISQLYLLAYQSKANQAAGDVNKLIELVGSLGSAFDKLWI